MAGGQGLGSARKVIQRAYPVLPQPRQSSDVWNAPIVNVGTKLLTDYATISGLGLMAEIRGLRPLGASASHLSATASAAASPEQTPDPV